jgi:hypothetical protein
MALHGVAHPDSVSDLGGSMRVIKGTDGEGSDGVDGSSSS